MTGGDPEVRCQPEDVDMETQSTHNDGGEFVEASQLTSSAKKAKAKKEKRERKKAGKAAVKAAEEAEKKQQDKAVAKALVTSTQAKKPTKRMLGGFTIPKVKTPALTKKVSLLPVLLLARLLQ